MEGGDDLKDLLVVLEEGVEHVHSSVNDVWEV